MGEIGFGERRSGAFHQCPHEFFVIERDPVLAVRKLHSLPLSVSSRLGLSKRHSPLLTIIFSMYTYGLPLLLPLHCL
jgi:hypothetical protein